MNALRLGSLVVPAIALSCRAQPAVAPRPSDPVVLVAPETGPSAL